MADPVCFICNTLLNTDAFLRSAGKGQSYYECPRCGSYSIHDLVSLQVDFSKVNNSKSILSYWVRNNQKNNPLHLTSELVKEIINDTKLPEINEQINNLILYIGQNTTYGKSVDITLNNIVALIGSQDKESLLFIFDELIRLDLIKVIRPSIEKASLMNRDVNMVLCHLTPTGWNKNKELNTQKKTAKEYNFKKHKPTKDELLWLKELLRRDWKDTDSRKIITALHNKLAPKFDPAKIDHRLISLNNLSLLGLWYVNPDHILIEQTDLTIKKISELITSNDIIDTVDAKLIASTLGIPDINVKKIFVFLCGLGFCSGGSGSPVFDSIQFGKEPTAYSKFFDYKNIEETLENYYNQYSQAAVLPHTKHSPNKDRRTKTKSYINQEVWKQIAVEFEISQNTFGRKINFVKDPYTRRVIFRDVQRAFQLNKKGFSKAAIILAGGVIEELLRLYLYQKGHTFKKNNFSEYIEICEANKYLRTGARRLTDSARDYRNLVHIANEASSKTEPTPSMASGAVSTIFTIVNEFK